MPVGGKQKLRIDSADHAGQAVIFHGAGAAFDIFCLLHPGQFAHTLPILEKMEQGRVFVDIQE